MDQHILDIEEIDTMRMADMLERFPKDCEEALKLGRDLRPESNEQPDAVVVLGMGGSSVSGDMVRAYLADCKRHVPVYTVRNYLLPRYITKKSIVFAISYSGNTEETVASYREASRLGARVIVLTSGGKLAILAKENEHALITVPTGIPPRLATPYLFFPLLTVLQNYGIIQGRPIEMRDAIAALKKPMYRELGKELAAKIGKTVPIIYASERFSVVAMKWKTDINENAKTHAFYNVYSEFNHNEINGYVNRNADFHVIIIRDDEDLGRIRKRMKITGTLIRQRGFPVTEVHIRGENYLTKLLSAIYTGLWLSYYLAIGYQTDPTPVQIIEDLKKELGTPL